MSFRGFAAGAQPTPLPGALLRDLAPAMSDPAELLVTLYACDALSRVRRFPRILPRADLEESRPLIEALASMCADRETSVALADGLDAAVSRGSLLAGRSQRDGAWVDWLALNDADGRRAMSAAAALPPPLAAARGRAPLAASAVAIYQEAFGAPAPSILVEELVSAESRYGVEWLRDAFSEAAANNARSWRYVQAILERWATEGREPGADREQPRWEADDVGTDPAQLGAGQVRASRFGHLFRG